MNQQNLLERLFSIKALGSQVKTEVLAGLTTFLTMSYIIIVNPAVLSQAGMDHGAVLVATCIAAAIGCLMMGLVANFPIALAPGMGLNAYFTYTVVLHQQVSWQTALAAVFCSGILFFVLNLFKIREALVNAMPMALKLSITAGIGFFLTFIALKGTGIIQGDQATYVKLGNIFSHEAAFTTLGFLIIVILEHFKVRGSILISILSITILSSVLGYSQIQGIVGQVPSLAPTFGQLDFTHLFTPDMIMIIFVFLLVDLFDSTGTLIGTAHRAGLLVDGKLPRLKRALFADSTAIVAGGLLGTSSTTPYIESASGVAAGGRTGLTAIVVGGLMLLGIFFAPLVSSVPSYATAPALIYVGVMMMESVVEIKWKDITEAVPAFLTIFFIPFTFSIADGIAIGFISYAATKLFSGYARSVPYMVWFVAIIWLLKFYFAGG